MEKLRTKFLLPLVFLGPVVINSLWIAYSFASFSIPGALGTAFAVGAAGLLVWGWGRQVVELARLRQAEKRSAFLMQNATEVLSLHDEQGDVTYMSPSSHKILGVAASQMAGSAFLAQIDPADKAQVERALRLAWREGKSVSAQFRLLPGKDAEQSALDGRHMEITYFADCGATGFLSKGHRAIVGVTKDVTALKAREDAAQEETESAKRMKSQFLANVGHEFKTPLNSVIGFAKILEREIGSDGQAATHREYAAHIRDGGEQIQKHVEDLLDVAKLQAGTYRLIKEPVNIASLVEAIKLSMEDVFNDKSITLVSKLSADLPPLHTDEQICKQILCALLTNAVQNSKAGTAITLRWATEGAGIVVKVTDAGEGIAQESLDSLDEPFAYVDGALNKKHLGLGLGLAKVKGVMALHDGQMKIESRVGQGTCVTLFFPRAERSSMAQKRQQDRPSSAQIGGRPAA